MHSVTLTFQPDTQPNPAELGIALHPLPAAYQHKAADGLGGFNPYGLHPDHVRETLAPFLALTSDAKPYCDPEPNLSPEQSSFAATSLSKATIAADAPAGC